MPQQPDSPRDLLLNRRTVHRFRSEPIPDGAVTRAIDAAIAAPNHKLSNPWRFIRVGPQTRDRITDRYVALKQQSKGSLSDDQITKYRNKVGDPPELVVPTQHLAADAFRRREDYAACACAIQNLMLSLWSEGIASKWTTGSITRDPETYGFLDLEKPIPAEQMNKTPDAGEAVQGMERILGFIWIGYPREDHAELDKPARRPPEEVTRHVD